MFNFVANITRISMLGAIIGTGINVVSNAIGAFIANKRKREAEEKYMADIQAEREALDKEINSNYLDRADARDAISKVRETTEESLRQLNTSAIRGGATDEAKVAMASKLNKNIAGVVGNIAAAGEQHKDRLKDTRRSLSLSAAQHRYNQASDVSGMATVLNNIGQAAQNLGAAWSSKPTAEVSPEVVEAKEFMDNADSTIKPSGKIRNYGEQNR